MDQAQVAQFWRDGFVLVESVVPDPLIQQARNVLAGLVEASRNVTVSNALYDLSDQHAPAHPRVRRIKDPHLVDEAFDRILKAPEVLKCVRQVLGEDLRLEHTKLNIKQANGGEAVEWHQDWAFYPYTNDDLLEVGVLLEDCTEENGPLLMIPGSHRGPVENHHHAQGFFCGAIDLEQSSFDPATTVALTGKAGSITMHHVRTVHGSRPNDSARDRPILLLGYCAADAWPLRGVEDWDAFENKMLCGTSQLPRLEKVPVRMPFPPAPGQGSIFENQKLVAGRSFRR